MCGIIGIYSKNADKFDKLMLGLSTLQHRGQDGVGIAGVETGIVDKKLGFLNEGFNPINDKILMGHLRYKTSGNVGYDNLQPLVDKTFTIAHNGNIPSLESGTTSDTYKFLIKLEEWSSYGYSPIQAIGLTHLQLEGAYSMIIGMKGALYALRDSQGIRPMCIGRFDDGDLVIASETAALKVIGAEFIRGVEPGELVKITDKIESVMIDKAEETSFCLFELIYFSRPDSQYGTRDIFEYRYKWGHLLGRFCNDIDADVVMGVPDSGMAAALGYSKGSGVPFTQGLVKNKHVGRTFIKSTQEERKAAVRLKLSIIPSVVRGKRVIIVDDSLVRGTTMKEIVSLLKEAGALEVHVAIPSPPVKYRCPIWY